MPTCILLFKVGDPTAVQRLKNEFTFSSQDATPFRELGLNFPHPLPVSDRTQVFEDFLIFKVRNRVPPDWMRNPPHPIASARLVDDPPLVVRELIAAGNKELAGVVLLP